MKKHMRFALIWVAGSAVILSACGRFSRMNSKGAIQEAIEAHLKQRPGLVLANMTTEVQEVKFDGDKATAEVTFQSREAAELKVEVRYILRRENDHWEVESSTPISRMGASPHGAAGPTQSVPASPQDALPPPQPNH